MHKVLIKPQWLLREACPEKPLWQLMELLKAVHDAFPELPEVVRDPRVT